MATVARRTLTATATRATPGVDQVGVGVDQVIGVVPGSPLGPLLAVASSPLDPLSTVAFLPLDLSSDAGPSHPFGVCGVLGAERRIGVRLSNRRFANLREASTRA
jgi:hypothetical protein